MTTDRFSYDTKSRLWIPFNTPKDAFFASLHFSKEVPSEILDQLLTIAIHPCFSYIVSCIHRNHEILYDNYDLTLKSSKDIVDITNATNRKCLEFGNRYRSTTPGIPDVILDLVVNTLIEDMEPLLVEAYILFNVPYTERLEIDIFRTMALVHPTWRSYAERGIYRRKILHRTLGGGLAMLPPPSISSHGLSMLRELAIWDVDYAYAADLLSYIPRLNHLCLFVSPTGEEKGILPFAEQLRKQISLERLSLQCEPIDPSSMVKFCEAISCLTRLKSCIIEFYDKSRTLADGVLPDAPYPTPPISLKSLVFGPRLPENSVSHACFDWFIQPRDGYILEELTTLVSNFFLIEDKAYLSTLTTLKIFFEGRNNYDSVSNVLNHNIFPETKNLRCLSLIFGKSDLEEYSLDLTCLASLEKLEIDLGFSGRKYLGNDSGIRRLDKSLLKYVSPLASQKLNEVVISPGNYTKYGFTCQTPRSMDTELICREHGVNLNIHWAKNLLHRSRYFLFHM